MERSTHGLLEALSLHLPEGSEENYKKLVNIISVPAEIRNENLTNARGKRYGLRQLGQSCNKNEPI